MKLRILTAAAVMLLLSVASATAAPQKSSTEQVAARLDHSLDVLRFFDNHRWMLATKQEKCWQVPWQKTCRIARHIYRKHRELVPELQAKMIPVGEAEIRAYIYRTYGRTEGECMATIIDWENVVWDPTVDYGFGHGNVYEAYGLPQALPGTKMASAGPDWRTNPITQLKWMYGYAVSRYGSLCGAFQHRRDHHMY